MAHERPVPQPLHGRRDAERVKDRRWVPCPTEEHRWRERLDADVRPLVDTLERLRDRGLLD